LAIINVFIVAAIIVIVIVVFDINHNAIFIADVATLQIPG
jgi:hypothetical protein